MNMKNIIELDDRTFDSQLRSAAGPVLVDFWAPWCGPCRMQLPILEATAERVKGRAIVAKVNVDQAPELAQRFNVSSIPTLLLFKNGQIVREFVGVQGEGTLVAAIEANN